jgi:hypothetical protein
MRIAESQARHGTGRKGTRAAGGTALFDALTRVTLEIGRRTGKKAVIVFTDGDDNASVVNSQRTTEPAKKSGIPLFYGGASRRAP